MDIDTVEAGAGSYPEPPNNSKTIKGEIVVRYSFEMEVPDNWSKERIEEDIKENLSDYLETLEEIVEIDF